MLADIGILPLCFVILGDVVMDFNSLKDTNNLKALLKSMGSDIAGALRSVKDVNAENFKSGFMTYFVDYLKNNYAKFDGRVSRRQYWMFTLYSMLVGIAFNIFIMILPFLAIFALLYAFALIVPSICLGIRRLHDLNLSGWFFLIALIPYIGGLALLFLFCIPGDAEDNKFGPAVR